MEQQIAFEYASQILVASTHRNPSGIQLYSNYAGVLTIQTNAALYGILTAPHAEVNMQSGSSCDGELHARKIVVDPDAIINSNLANPEADSDGDGVPNITEVYMNTDPTDATSVIPVAVPSPALIDPSVDNVVNYNFSIFYRENFHGMENIEVTIPAGAMATSMPPLIYVSNQLPDGYTQTNIFGYKQNGRVFAIEGAFTGNEDIEFDLPVNDDSPGDKDRMKAAFLPKSAPPGPAEEDLTVSTSQEGYAQAYAPVASIVAYADGAATYSSKEYVRVDMDIALDKREWEGATGTFKLYYNDRNDVAQTPVTTQLESESPVLPTIHTSMPYMERSHSPVRG
ncbi:MAG: hypothetical protein ACLFSB_15440, partial [Chitinispirillaceae bacterium]